MCRSIHIVYVYTYTHTLCVSIHIVYVYTYTHILCVSIHIVYVYTYTYTYYTLPSGLPFVDLTLHPEWYQGPVWPYTRPLTTLCYTDSLRARTL